VKNPRPKAIKNLATSKHGRAIHAQNVGKKKKILGARITPGDSISIGGRMVNSGLQEIGLITLGGGIEFAQHENYKREFT